MFGVLESYHPFRIYQQKRELKTQVASIAEAAPVADVAPVVEETPLQKAKKSLEALSDLVGKMESKFNELMKLSAEALKSGTTDVEQRKLNKTFQSLKKDMDGLAKTKMNSEMPFSGKALQKPILLDIGEGIAPMEVRLDGCDCKNLGIDQSRIDSLSYAKKARGDLERAKSTILMQYTHIIPKLELVNSKISSLAIADSTLEAAKSVSVSRDDYLDLKILQERAARAKGRTNGLLINIKV